MECRSERREKSNKVRGVPASAKYFFLLPFFLGVSLIPSTRYSSKTFYEEFHSMVFHDTRVNRNIAEIRNASDDSPSNRRRDTTSHHEDFQDENDENDDPHHNPSHDGMSDKATTATATTTSNTATKQSSSTTLISEPHDNPRTDDSSIRVPHFEKQEGVVIVTQIHGPHQYGLLRQSFCLLHKAYNFRLLYDLVVFLAEPLSFSQRMRVRYLVYPAKITFVNNAPKGLPGVLEELSPERRNRFLKRCNIHPTEIHNLTWWSECPGRLAYNWQAEFRSLRIWRQPALAKYKYMVWLDSDVFATSVWKYDPVAYMVAHDLVVLFGHSIGGRAKPKEVRKVREFYGKSFCKVRLTKDGFLNSPTDRNCKGFFPVIHGFFHITNLDFYRTDEVQRWLTHFREHCFLCREFDDQAAMTVPAAMLAPNRSKDMRKSGLILNNFHNAFIDGQIRASPAGFKKYWAKFRSNFSEADGACTITERS